MWFYATDKLLKRKVPPPNLLFVFDENFYGYPEAREKIWEWSSEITKVFKNGDREGNLLTDTAKET